MTHKPAPVLVVDASVAIAIAVQEPRYERAVLILRERRAARHRLIVPAFFWLELVNVLMRRHQLTPAEVLQALFDLDGLGLESVELDQPSLLLTLDVMGRFGLSAYDASYLALAESSDGELLTFDRRLAGAAGGRLLPIPGHTVEETPEPYAASWSDWPGAAAYLKQLRAQVVRQANG